MVIQRSRRSEKATLDQAPPELVEDSEDSDDDCQHKRHTGKKQKQHARRQCLDRLRLYLLQGRFNLALPPIQAWIMAALLGFSAAAYWNQYHLPDFLVGHPQTTEWRSKPLMVGVYFTDVDSDSFSGKVKRIEPPRGRREWMTLLENRLRHRHNHPQQQHHHHEILPGLVEPMSLHLEYIETGSERYHHKPRNAAHPDQCEPMHEWQTKSFPSCNNLHEHSLMRDRFFWDSSAPDHKSSHHSPDHSHNPDQPLQKKLRRRLLERTRQESTSHSKIHYQLQAHGYWRDTWLMQQPTTTEAGIEDNSDGNEMERVAMKTMRFEHDFNEFVYDKQRRDALTSDRLSFSDHTIHMWAYCGTSALYEYAPGGDLTRFVDKFDKAEDWREYYTPEERFGLAFNVSAALSDLHNTENNQGEDGPSAIVHADFNVNQFVAMTDNKEDGHEKKGKRPIPQFKLGDFNLAKFIYKNPKQHHPCTVQTEGSRGNWRAPEEYNKRGRTEKLDVYSLGNLLYVILTGNYPFEDIPDEKTREMVSQGDRPHIGKSIQQSDDPYIKALLAAIEMCWRQDAHDRPSAREINRYLAKHLSGDTTVGRRRHGHRHR